MAGDRQSFDKAMNQGHSAVWDQSWEKAAGYYRQALKEFPEDAKALNSLALALYESGEYTEALTTYQRAAQAAPDDPIPVEKVASLLERLGRTDQAVEVYMHSTELYFKARDVNKCIDLWHHVSEINPDYMQAHSRLGYVFERLGRKAEAVKEYLVVASLFQQAGDMQKALQAVTHALQVMPDSTEAGQAVGMLKMGRLLPRPTLTRRPYVAPQEPGKKGGADAAQQTVAQDPVAVARHKALSTLAGLLFDSMEEGGSGTSSGMQAITRGSSSSSIAGQADTTRIQLGLSQVVDYISRKEDAKAIEELEQMITGGLDHPAAFLIYGMLLGESGRMESAVRNLQRAITAPDLALGANLYMGQLLLKMNRVQEAAAALLEALKYADLQTVPENQMAQLARKYTPIIEAQATETIPPKKMCDAILDMLAQPDWLERVRRARQQMLSQQTGVLSPVAELLTEASSSGIVDSLSQIQKLEMMGKFRSAMEEAFLAIEIAPTYLPLHIVMGDLLVKQGMIPEATQKFQMIAQSYQVREDINRAIEIYRHILEFAPMDVQARETLIRMLLETRQFEDAANEYVKQSEAYYARADLENVRSSLTNALKLAEDNNLSRVMRADLLGRIADIDMQSLDWRASARTYEQIRNLKPDDEQARATLIDLYLRLNLNNQAGAEISGFVKYLFEKRQQNQAIAFVEKLAVDHPEQPMVIRQLADLYRQVGRAEEAIQRYDAAGELYLNAGNKKAAAEAIMALLSLNPPNAAEYQQVLAQLRL